MSGGVYDDAMGAAGAGSGAGVDRAAAHRMAMALSATGVIIEQHDGCIVEVNEAAARFLGYAPGELVGRSYAALCAPDDEVAQIALRLDLFAGERVKDEGMRRYVRKDGRTIECHAAVSVAPGADAAPAVVTVLQTDAGAESAESQHAKQRLNMLGLFAAGIAHDFNNVLSIIRCNSEFARDALDGQAPDVRAAVTDLLEVERAAERASGLVRQLLAFAGRQARHPQHLDINEVVRDAATFLRVSIGNEIQVVLRLAPTLPPVLADRSQLDQVLMNLVFNARDAIAEAQVAERERGGAARPAVLTIATAAEYVGAAAVAIVSTAGRAAPPRPRSATCASTIASRALNTRFIRT
jgi:PAS domain S-box-containing protein